MSDRYDLAVIGAGPGGYVAAARAAQLGLQTVLIEKEPRLGGTCLLRGCIPTKALLHAAEVWQICKKGSRPFGVTTEAASFDWARVQKRKEMATVKGSKGVDLLMKSAGVTVLSGHGRLAGPGRIAVAGADETQEIAADKIVLATGSMVTAIPGIDVDGEKILTSDHLLAIDHIPESLIVLGAGAVGLEMASMMQAFGSKVNLVEMLDRVLPLEDPECCAEVAKALKRQGMKVHTSCRADNVEACEGGVRATLTPVGESDTQADEPLTLDAACLLVAVGRRPVTDDLGLDTVGLETERGFVPVDGQQETPVPGIYAIGDIVATPQLAHVASREALVAVGQAAGKPLPPIKYDLVPSCTYSNPEVASVGLSEQEAASRGHDVTTGKFPFSALGKASILNEPHGFTKVVADAETGAVLGVHLVGPRVTELIAGAATALGLEASLEQWSAVIHPHPSLSEAVLEAVHAAAGEPLHGG